MQRKPLFILIVLVLLISNTLTAFARSVRISGETFRLDLTSIIADGTISGLGDKQILVDFVTWGHGVITCINEGGNEVPGRNDLKVSAAGQVLSSGNDTVDKNGIGTFSVVSRPPALLTGEDAVQFGCSNTNWTARIDFVFWDTATINVYDTNTGMVLISQSYICTTTRFPSAVSCVRVR